MGTCLFNQLKGEASNEMLPTLNYITLYGITDTISQKSVNGRYIVVDFNANTQSKLINEGGNFVDRYDVSIGNEITINTSGSYGKTIRFSTDTERILVEFKNLKELNIADNNFNLNAKFALGDLLYTQIAKIAIVCPNTSIKVDELSAIQTLTEIEINSTILSGSFVDFAKLSGLTSLSIFGTGNMVTGEFADWGWKNKTLTFRVDNNNRLKFTVNGVVIPSGTGIITKTITFDENGNVSMS